MAGVGKGLRSAESGGGDEAMPAMKVRSASG